MLANNELSFWLNYTDLEPKIATAPLATGSTPRFLFKSNFIFLNFFKNNQGGQCWDH